MDELFQYRLGHSIKINGVVADVLEWQPEGLPTLNEVTIIYHPAELHNELSDGRRNFKQVDIRDQHDRTIKRYFL